MSKPGTTGNGGATAIRIDFTCATTAATGCVAAADGMKERLWWRTEKLEWDSRTPKPLAASRSLGSRYIGGYSEVPNHRLRERPRLLELLEARSRAAALEAARSLAMLGLEELGLGA